MSLKYALLATEGPQDQAVICRLLRLLGLEIFKGDRKFLSEDQFKFWKRLIPDSSANIYKRLDMQMPRIFTSSTHSVAIYQGQGSSLPQNLSDIIHNYDPYAQDIDALGLIVDADNSQPSKIAKKYADALRVYFPMISEIPGTITTGIPRTGIYVLPDNVRQGTLDSILVDCAANVYPDHKAGAEGFLSSLDAAHKSHWKPFDHEKAIVATIVSVIQPGIASRLSLARAKDRWICEQTKNNVPEVADLYNFIRDPLELPITEAVVSPAS